MPNNSPTIVAASLNDEKLKASIEQMVQNLNAGLEKMKTSTDAAVEYMQKSLQKLGDTKIDSGGSADGGASRRAKAQNEETMAVKETTTALKEQKATFDDVASAMQKAAQPKSARESYYAFVKGFKEQAEAIKGQIQDMPFGASDKVLQLEAEYRRVTNAMKDEVVTKQKLTEEERRLQQATEARRVAIERMSQMSKEDLQATFKQFSSMPATGFDQISNKLEQMKMTVAAMRSSGLFDATELNKAQNSVDNLEKKLKKTPEYAEKLSLSTQHVVEATQRATSASKELIAEEKRAVRESMNNERARSQAIIDSARTAQQEWRRVINDMINNKVMDSGEPIKMSYIKSLEDSFARMKRAWFELSDAERTSPFGISLINDLVRVKKAMQEIRAYGQNLLGIENVGNNMLTKNSSIESLKNSIKQLTSQYNQLTIEEIRAGKGDALIRKFQETTRAAQVLQKQLSTPLTFADANNIQVRTLDDMAYKLRMLQSYKQGIDVTKPNAAEEINKVDAAIVQLKKDMDKYMSSTKAADNATNALNRSLNYMKNRLAFYFTVGASTQFVKNLIDIRAQYEMNERALGILVNSAERGTQIFKELSEMALMSPYTLIELSTAAKQLTAYDVAAKDVVDTTRRLADMTAAVGIPIERLTYAIGQVKAYGYLNARDARMFSNAGIPLVKELADYYSKLEGHLVSVADVYDKIKKKAIGYNDVMSVVTKMTDEGGKFFDFQAKMAGTLKVQLANLTLAWNNMLNEIGSSEQGALSSVIGGLKELFLQWKNIEGVINTVLVAFGLWKAAQLTALAFTGDLTGAMAAQVVMGTKLQAKFASMAAGMKAASIGISAAGMAFWLVLADGIMTYMRNAEEVQALNKSIADGAKESAESISKFLESSEIYQNRLNASTGKLPKAEAEKTWEALREQIEMTADSSDEIIATLLDPKKYDNINDRLTEGFNILESIRNVTEKLSDMFDKLDVSQDTILFGALGEGLAEDIEDYSEKLKYTAEVAEWSAKKNRDFWENAAMGLSVLFNEVKDSMGNDEEEAKNEIRNFAKSAADVIKDELGEEALGDKIQVNEAIARVIQGMEKQFPQIRGKGKALFETIFNDVMATEFEGAVDKQAYYYNLFLNRLKKDHASAFQDVTDGILDDTHTWNSAQLDAIKKTADKVKEDLPAASQDAINQILNQLNKTDFKLRIVTEFATTTQDEVNKQFRKRFISAPSIMTDEDEREKYETIKLQKYGTLMKKTEESNLEYEDRIKKKREENIKISEDAAKIIEANKNKTDDASKAIVANAEEEKKAADDFLESAKRVEDWGGYDFSTKNENKAASKAQKSALKAQATAEKEVTEAFKNELSVLKEMQSAYDKLRKAGVDNTTAIDLASRGYEQTLRRVNATLAKYGISKFNASDFLGKNVNDVLKTLERQRDDALASGKLKSSELKELDVEISKLNVDAKTYNMDKITKGLNNELGKLKDEYELAVELDASPDLGNIFADMLGLDADDMAQLPRDFNSLIKKMQSIIDANVTQGFDLLANLNKSDLSDWFAEHGIKQDSDLAKQLTAFVDYANKIRQDEMKKQIDNWDKLLEKYSEYQYQINKIQNDAAQERVTFARRFGTESQIDEAIDLKTKIVAATDPVAKQELVDELKQLVTDIAGDDETRLNIAVGIANKETHGIATKGFEEFQKTPEWVVATGNLAGMTDTALGMLIQRIEQYKKTAKNLDPKQIKEINRALKNLRNEQRKNNPFLAIGAALEEAKERASEFEPELTKITKQIQELEDEEKKEGKLTDDKASQLSDLRKRYKEIKSLSKVSSSEIVSYINSAISAGSKAVGIFTDMADALGGENMTQAAKKIKQVTSILEKGGEGAAIGAQIGGGWGAAIGGVLGTLGGVISNFADEWSGNADITEAIEDSTLKVKQLERAYKQLADAAEDAYGIAAIGAQRATITNKELQLVELKRQLQLEESRKEKNRDEERIESLKSEIVDLELEIKNATKDIVNDLLGISSIGDAAENLVNNMIQAFKNGEDYMKSYQEAFDNMVDNMIMKAIVGEVIGNKVKEMFEQVKAIALERANSTVVDALDIMNEWYAGMVYVKDGEKHSVERSITEWRKYLEDRLATDSLRDDYREEYEKALSRLDEIYKQSVNVSPQDIDEIREMVTSWKGGVKDEFEMWMNAFGVSFGESNTADNLSALQQGIQGITEDTAGALEAYMNGVSQQVYLHSEILVQIRDAVVGFDLDVQVATMSQILLQLQQSYAAQMAIRGILEGWSNASGQAVRVEMI